MDTLAFVDVVLFGTVIGLVLALLVIAFVPRGAVEVLIEVSDGSVDTVSAGSLINVTIVDWDTQDEVQEMNAHAAYEDVMSCGDMRQMY